MKIICEHNKLKTRCIDCNGGSLCQEHGKRKDECKICSDNSVNILVRKMIRNARKYDKGKNYYDETNFIDYEFVNFIIEKSYNLCFYCGKQLQHIYNEHNLATIERLNNTIGHTKENCVIACKFCNLGNIGERLDFEI